MDHVLLRVPDLPRGFACAKLLDRLPPDCRQEAVVNVLLHFCKVGQVQESSGARVTAVGLAWCTCLIL
jgi:hypothetical protein